MLEKQFRDGPILRGVQPSMVAVEKAVLTAIAAVLIIANSLPVYAADLYFVGDPNLSGNLFPWEHIQVGETAYKVADHPEGMTAGGSVSVVSDPLGAEGRVYKLTVSASTTYQASSATSDRVDLWNNPRPYMGQEGQENWEHFRILFLSRGDAYSPAPGNWNWIAQHHNDPRYKPFIQSGAIQAERPELAWGIDTKGNLPNGERATALFMVIRGGDDRNQGKETETRIHANSPLQYDHWYDFLVHVIWSHDPRKGLVEWLLDGNTIFVSHIANLWQRPDGSTDHVNFEFSNYRVHATWYSTIYFSRVKIGASREAVSF
jgi:hypothetical protein